MAASSPVITIYKNGDRNFHGKKIVVNKRYYRSFENFLDKVTSDTSARVAIRKIHTPHHGTRVDSLEQIQNGAIYVAAGSEKFRHFSYGETSILKSNNSTPTLPPFQSKHVGISRYKKEAMAEPLKNRIIFVYRNGEKKTPPTRILVDKRSLSNMDVLLQFISDRIKLTSGAVKSLYSLETMSKVIDVGDIHTNMPYVAVGSGKVFHKGKYLNHGRDKETHKPENHIEDTSTGNEFVFITTDDSMLQPLHRGVTFDKLDESTGSNNDTPISSTPINGDEVIINNVSNELQNEDEIRDSTNEVNEHFNEEENANKDLNTIFDGETNTEVTSSVHSSTQDTSGPIRHETSIDQEDENNDDINFSSEDIQEEDTTDVTDVGEDVSNKTTIDDVPNEPIVNENDDVSEGIRNKTALDDDGIENIGNESSHDEVITEGISNNKPTDNEVTEDIGNASISSIDVTGDRTTPVNDEITEDIGNTSTYDNVSGDQETQFNDVKEGIVTTSTDDNVIGDSKPQVSDEITEDIGTTSIDNNVTGDRTTPVNDETAEDIGTSTDDNATGDQTLPANDKVTEDIDATSNDDNVTEDQSIPVNDDVTEDIGKISYGDNVTEDGASSVDDDITEDIDNKTSLDVGVDSDANGRSDEEALTLYKASGEQQESGKEVKDGKETMVEHLIDSLPAEEVKEELE